MGVVGWGYGREIYFNNIEQVRDRVFLICIEEKCMSGKIVACEIIAVGKIKVEINFIEPSYFYDVLKSGVRFTVREASKVLMEGIITELPRKDILIN